MINNVAVLDRAGFELAKPLISAANLLSVRFLKFNMTFSPDESDGEDLIELSSSSKSNGELTKRGMVLYFDLRLRGTRTGETVLDIAARIEAIYDLPADEQATEVQIKAFAKANGMLNIWPYWREYVQSATQRAGLAPLTLPLFRVVSSSQAKTVKH